MFLSLLDLYLCLVHFTSFSPSLQSLEGRQQLPIAALAGEIVAAVQRHQVIIVKGNTGCGKTTQVPQFILDNMIANQNGAHCNIVVTQVCNLLVYSGVWVYKT